jgi:hypothetical protein
MSPIFVALLKALLPMLMPVVLKWIEDWLNKQQAVIDQWRAGQLPTPQFIERLRLSAESDLQALTQQP